MHCAMHTLMLRIRYSTRRSAVPELALGLYPIHPILQSVTIVLGLIHTSGSVEVVTVQPACICLQLPGVKAHQWL